MELKVFQSSAAALIAKRYTFFANHPDRPSRGPKPRPFFQALSALTGAGKTPLLAQAVSLIRAHLHTEPIVFWMSKARPVVAQTLTNFSTGGKYSEIVDGFQMIGVANLTPALIADSSNPLMILATTGLFNNRDQSEGTLNIYKKDNDQFGDQSPWDRLIERSDGNQRRPLLIVYDEGHNLSEQQTELLAELEPDAYLLASATLRLPQNFQKSVIQPISLWVGESGSPAEFKELEALDKDGNPSDKAFVTTAISSELVVKAGLVKMAIQFDGTTAPMSTSLDALTSRLATLDNEIALQNLSFRPKAIYVCKTNINDDGLKDDPALPFNMREAPPIRIWRYLVDEKSVSPSEIAIYADLKFADGSKPDEVNLFSKGDSDFDTFKAADYRHVIFNLSLQEGWDDPECYLAYIDKSMGSTTQVEQVIGRVLRQYGATHYDSQLLNSAHFFLRVDDQNVFAESIRKVKSKLRSQGAPIEITESFGTGAVAAEDLLPRDQLAPALHHVFVDSEAARQRIDEIIGDFPAFTDGDLNTVGEAHSAQATVQLLAPNKESKVDWTPDGHTNPIRLRWLASTAIKSRSSRALAVIDLKDPKFDIRVQANSKAAKLIDTLAKDVVEAFYQFSDLVYESLKPVAFGTMRVGSSNHAFQNSLYERYSGLNGFELEFATALDGAGVTWHRNIPSGGFGIPLLSEGDTASFYPDFIAWQDSMVFCLDTKGGHLLSDAVARKLFDIQEDGKSKLLLRLISKGRQEKLLQKPLKGGFTVWKMKQGSPTPIYVQSLAKAVAECLKK